MASAPAAPILSSALRHHLVAAWRAPVNLLSPAASRSERAHSEVLELPARGGDAPAEGGSAAGRISQSPDGGSAHGDQPGQLGSLPYSRESESPQPPVRHHAVHACTAMPWLPGQPVLLGMPRNRKCGHRSVPRHLQQLSRICPLRVLRSRSPASRRRARRSLTTHRPAVDARGFGRR